MDHVAILRKSNFKKGDNILGDILSGRKTVESRWYVNKVAPWDRISAGDTVYFKESGCPVTAKATVGKVLQYELSDPEISHEIVKRYGKQIAPSLSEEFFMQWVQKHEAKRYCILIFLENVKKVVPFTVNKNGFGSATAWLVLDKKKADKD